MWVKTEHVLHELSFLPGMVENTLQHLATLDREAVLAMGHQE